MDFNSTDELQPNFFRGLYLSKLNNRVTDIENELDLLNLNMVTNDAMIRQQISDLQNAYNEQFITANLIANKANINYLEVTNFANVDNIFANNIWTEHLTVNKPVYDLTLNTPHIENASSLNGNFYSPNLFNAYADIITAETINVSNIEVPVLANVNRVETNSILIKNDITMNFNLNNIDIEQSNLVGSNVVDSTLINTAIELGPTERTYNVVGFNTETGVLFPAVVSANISLPENADYLYTNEGGYAFAGTADNEVTQDSTNLIQSAAVYNLSVNINEAINNINLNNVYDYVNTGLNNLSNDINKNFNASIEYTDRQFTLLNTEINRLGERTWELDERINRLYDTFNYEFDLVNHHLDYMNAQYDDLSNNVNNLSNTVNEFNVEEITNLKNTVNNLQDYINSFIITPDYFNSTSPVNFQSMTAFGGFYTTETEGVNVNGVMINLNLIVTPGISYNLLRLNFAYGQGKMVAAPTNFSYMFNGCTLWDGAGANLWDASDVKIPDSVTEMRGTFFNCLNFNGNVTLPANLINGQYLFYNCLNLNTPIHFPNGQNLLGALRSAKNLNSPVTFDECPNISDVSEIFMGCGKFNQPVVFPSNTQYLNHAFLDCTNLNAPIEIPAGAVCIQSMFTNCNNFNQPVNIPDNVINTSYMFLRAYNFNSPVSLGNNVTSAADMFSQAYLFNQPITIPSSMEDARFMIYNCTNFNSEITFNEINHPVDFGNMLTACVNFNKPLNFDNVKNGGKFSGILSGVPNYNSPVDLGNGVNMNYARMFEGSNYNSPVTVGALVDSDLSSMFGSGTKYNQDLDLSQTVNCNFSDFMKDSAVMRANVLMPATASNCERMFSSLYHFNSPLTIPVCPSINRMIGYCSRYNQVITEIPEGVIYAADALANCYNMNCNVKLPSTLVDASNLFKTWNQQFNIAIDVPSNLENAYQMFVNCVLLNVPDMNIYSDKLTNMERMFTGTQLYNCNIHIPNTVPLEAGNYIYDALTNGLAGIDFTGKIFNDL